jgi:hypothetical protein
VRDLTDLADVTDLRALAFPTSTIFLFFTTGFFFAGFLPIFLDGM